MAVTDVLNAGGTTPQTQPQSQVGLSALNGQDFMKVLVKQLQYQDPLKPMDNEQMVSQISSIRQMELNTQLTNSLQQLSDQQRFGSAAALIGKYATGELKDDTGTSIPMSGTVTGIRFNPSGDIVLELDSGQLMPLKAVTQVTNEPALAS